MARSNIRVLALDLDNTLWGGVIGDDGQEGISIGQETAEAEAYTEVQEYCKAQKQLGVLLTICSKNEPENARLGLSHPDSVLHEDDFVAIKANWEPKDRNLVQTAAELSLLPESFVFVDDNPAEREIVSAQIAGIAVPEFQDPADCIRVLDHAGYFETTTFSAADASRSEMYRANAQRAQMQQYVVEGGDLGVDVQQILGDGQMARAGDGQKFRHALDQAQKNRLQKGHRFSPYLKFYQGVWPRIVGRGTFYHTTGGQKIPPLFLDNLRDGRRSHSYQRKEGPPDGGPSSPCAVHGVRM